jgi:hypothetical protein
MIGREAVGDDDLVLTSYLMYEKGLHAKEDIGISWALAALLAYLDLPFLFAELIFSGVDRRRWMVGGWMGFLGLLLGMLRSVRMRREAENVVYWRMLCRLLQKRRLPILGSGSLLI